MATIETLERVGAALNAIEFDVDLAVVVVELQIDVHDDAILVLAFCLEVVDKLGLPAWFSLPSIEVSTWPAGMKEGSHTQPENRRA